MKLGIIAPEFPPTTGGMRNHALGLSRELSRHCEVTVFTRTEPTPEGDGLELRPILDNDIHEDVKKLRTHEADAWLVLTAGYADFARHTDLPTFVYCHGNDFLNPWVLQDTAADRLARIWARTPLVWRAEKLRHALLRPTRRAAIGRGLRHAAHVFTNSDYTRRILVDLWPGLDGKLTVSYPGVDEMFFAPPAASAAGRAARDTLRMISIARLSRVQSAIKNIDSSLEALARLPAGTRFPAFGYRGRRRSPTPGRAVPPAPYRRPGRLRRRRGPPKRASVPGPGRPAAPSLPRKLRDRVRGSSRARRSVAPDPAGGDGRGCRRCDGNYRGKRQTQRHR